ncbi:N-acetylmuramoyl L-alalanine amidase [Lysinibacillus sphaericus]|uniref:peptidoglycan recognition protein family protein n=1 Tax=Lysinibacillus sphaericus TaxID=1421 RepID=UPI0018CD3A4D|nr:N-acetylmuramoyl-L-alanine amidase [Lysinibacillus sphaericus]MBG9455996.1 N-acetylmuramoyl L-alalanine amidase [Lysinibacillus sphaericus]MBG9479641.1 N-acetylmuramoyl L-alalanine amidase [Lysinibacillus sphaericus]MBG9593877.1 N-acetylmuramoyl L-alalanine amidase [Lysinibacillus sphaericus]
MTYIIEKRLMSGLPNLALTAVKYVIAHESGNSNNNGPNALENELAFMNQNKANAFTSHWVGGGGRIVQVAPVNRVQYGCGPKGNPLSYAQVELARTNDKEQFKKDYAAYIWLLRELAKEAGLPIVLDSSGNGIKSHRWVADTLGGTTHNDPFPYLQTMGITDEQFKLDIKNGLDQQQTDKDDDIMRFTNETTKAAVRDYIKQSVDKKLIDKLWLDKFDQGTLTGGDFEGLKIIIKQRGG